MDLKEMSGKSRVANSFSYSQVRRIVFVFLVSTL